MPESGIKLKQHKDILSLEEIFDVVKYAVSIGITKIRLTGGEPLIRKNIGFLVEKIGNLSGIKDFGMTTNGTLLTNTAQELKEKGLHRVNISLDSLNADRYRSITRGGEIKEVINGINAAIKAGLTPVKLNVVLIPKWNEDEREQFLLFGQEHNVDIRFIRQMNLKCGSRHGIEGNTNVGICNYCNRLRLTCDGNLKPCLFSDYSANVRKFGIEKAFCMALANKPETGLTNEKEFMYQIGG